MSDSSSSPEVERCKSDSEKPTLLDPKMSIPVSNKRRTQSYEPESPRKRQKFKATYTRHPVFWLFDGNCYLQIGSVRFCIHMSRLMKQSSWFERHFEKDNAVEFPDDDNDDDADLQDVLSGATIFAGRDLYYLDSTGVTLEDFEIFLTVMDRSMYAHIFTFFLKHGPNFDAVNIFRRNLPSLPLLLSYASPPFSNSLHFGSSRRANWRGCSPTNLPI